MCGFARGSSVADSGPGYTWPSWPPPPLSFRAIKLHSGAINKIYYPDVMVLCEPGDDHPSIKRQPCFIAEVLSPSTEATDRREKLEAYRAVPDLQTYAIVDPHRRYVEVHQNAGGIWRAVAVQGDGVVVIPCLDTSLSLDGIYEGLAPQPE